MTSLRQLLPRAFTPFFHRFPNPTPVQIKGIPPLLAGKNVMLCAPTASGKTEAYAAPLVERLLASKRGPARVLLISPTRALANDLKRRLDGPMHQAGVSLGRYTGEHKERVGSNLPEVVVATPEALDSLLARRSEMLTHLQALVLDEIHMLDGTPRGDQLRILLHRLPTSDCQRVAASATVEQPGELAARYGITDMVIEAGKSQPIGAKMFHGRAPQQVASHLAELATAGIRKVLIFANARNTVEEYAAALRDQTPFGRQVYAHHGSLAKGVRQRTEKLYWDAPAAVCLATLTLELGIDIGTVDYVMLLDPPTSPASLRQRIGRGARRAEKSRVGCVCGGKADELSYRVLLKQAAKGDLRHGTYAFRPGVILQQALVLAGSEGWVSAKRLSEVLPGEIKKQLPADGTSLILAQAAERNLFEPAGDHRYVLTENQETSYNRGTLHSNIATAREITVIDRLTGDQLGQIDKNQQPGDNALSLGGQNRRLAHTDGGRLLTDQAQHGSPTQFTPNPRPVIPHHQARALAAELGANPDELIQHQSDTNWLLLHATGTIGGMLLAAWWKSLTGTEPISAGPLLLRLQSELTTPARPDPLEAQALLNNREKKLAAALAMGPYHLGLPINLRRNALKKAAELDQLLEFLARARSTTRYSPAPEVWEDLAMRDIGAR